MDKACRKKKRMKTNMCVYSGKPIGSKDAVLVEYAKDYLKKLGYAVSNKPIFLFFMVFLLIFSLSFVSATGTIRANYSINDDNILHCFGNSLNAQVFNNTNGTFDLTSIKLKIYKAGTPGTMNVYLSPVNATGYPVSSTILSSGSYNAEDLTTGTGGDWYEINMSSYELSLNTKYAIWFNCTTCSGFSDDINWRTDASSPAYTFGQGYYTSDGGAIWLDYSAVDNLFEVYGTEIEGCSENLVNTSWSFYQNSSCNVTDLLEQSRFLIQYDENFCGETENETFWDNITFECNYCSSYPMNFTLDDWYDITECIDESKTQNSTILTYDYNNDTCYALTGLESDYFNEIIYYLQRDIYCMAPFQIDTSLFSIDLESKTTIVIFVFLFVFVILLGYFRKWLFVGGLLVFLGFMLLFNSFNPLLSFIIIVGGVLALFLK